jgi:23S rRNA pseudouridine1911/1915/1917 synthase
MDDEVADHELEASGQRECLSVQTDEEHLRLDAFLVKHFPQFSRAKIQRAVAAGNVLVDGDIAKSSTRLKVNQQVEFGLPNKASDAQKPENIPLDIVYEDSDLVVINKPAGMVVHPSKGHWSGTLTAALTFHFGKLSSVGGPTRPGIVHRLDRDTSGAIIIAKTDEAHSALSQQFEQRTVEKEYWAIVTPAPNRDRDLIDKPIGAHPYQREKKAIISDPATSRHAQTYFEVVERFRGFALIRVLPKTGRTHQIRVHMAHAGSPVLCDRLYSGRARVSVGDFSGESTANDELILERQALHAHRIKFSHPRTGESIECIAELSEDLTRTLACIRRFRSLG